MSSNRDPCDAWGICIYIFVYPLLALLICLAGSHSFWPLLLFSGPLKRVPGPHKYIRAVRCPGSLTCGSLLFFLLYSFTA